MARAGVGRGVIAASGPTALWYAARSTGYVSLLLLTVILALGITTAVRWSNREWPRFASQALHRNLSLLVLIFLALHIATTVLDPFASIAPLNAVAPFTGSYRPIWLGLGVVSVELMVALTITSLLRDRIGFRAWRWIHWAAYASWPAAVLHTLGTGSDVRSVWAIGLTLLCVGAVFLAIALRLLANRGRVPVPVRVAGLAVSAAATAAVLGFAAAGPLQNGWARAAGTPANLLATTARNGGAAISTTTASPAPVAALPVNLSDQVSGSLAQRSTGLELDLRDARDASMTIVVALNAAQTSGALSISRAGAVVCTGALTVANDLRGACGHTGVVITLSQLQDGSLAGRLVTSASAP